MTGVRFGRYERGRNGAISAAAQLRAVRELRRRAVHLPAGRRRDVDRIRPGRHRAESDAIKLILDQAADGSEPDSTSSMARRRPPARDQRHRLYPPGLAVHADATMTLFEGFRTSRTASTGSFGQQCEFACHDEPLGRELVQAADVLPGRYAGLQLRSRDGGRIRERGRPENVLG
jgi:hypothetical protein